MLWALDEKDKQVPRAAKAARVRRACLQWPNSPYSTPL